jgi:hypothetical protein
MAPLQVSTLASLTTKRKISWQSLNDCKQRIQAQTRCRRTWEVRQRRVFSAEQCKEDRGRDWSARNLCRQVLASVSTMHQAAARPKTGSAGAQPFRERSMTALTRHVPQALGRRTARPVSHPAQQKLPTVRTPCQHVAQQLWRNSSGAAAMLTKRSEKGVCTGRRRGASAKKPAAGSVVAPK